MSRGMREEIHGGRGGEGGGEKKAQSRRITAVCDKHGNCRGISTVCLATNNSSFSPSLPPWINAVSLVLRLLIITAIQTAGRFIEYIYYYAELYPCPTDGPTSSPP